MNNEIIKFSGGKFIKLKSKYKMSNIYMLLKNKSAIIIDPHRNFDMISILKDNNIEDIIVFFTHEHSDHTCGISLIMDSYKTKIICQKYCSDFISDKKNNLPNIYIKYILSLEDKKNNTHYAQEFINSFEGYACKADITFDTEYTFHWNDTVFQFVSTPGHSPGSCCILVNNELIFTGDSLLSEYPVITRFPGGSAKDYEEKTLPYLKSLNKELIVLPGHGKICKLSEILRGE